MTLTQQRVIEIREALNSAARPSTYHQLEKYVAVHKTHIARLIQEHSDLYHAIMRNKKDNRLTKLREQKAEIDEHMKANDCSASYACLALGYDASRYAQLKRWLA